MLKLKFIFCFVMKHQLDQHILIFVPLYLWFVCWWFELEYDSVRFFRMHSKNIFHCLYHIKHHSSFLFFMHSTCFIQSKKKKNELKLNIFCCGIKWFDEMMVIWYRINVWVQHNFQSKLRCVQKKKKFIIFINPKSALELFVFKWKEKRDL